VQRIILSQQALRCAPARAVFPRDVPGWASDLARSQPLAPPDAHDRSVRGRAPV